MTEACAVDLSPKELDAFFRSKRRTPPLDATHIAVCQKNPALIPLMFIEFARSSLSFGGANDPDVFERMLRGLQSFHFEVVRERLESMDLTPLADAIHAKFLGNWFRFDEAALAEGRPEPYERLGALPPQTHSHIVAEVEEWLTSLLSLGPKGLILLQTDSGGALVWLQRSLEDDMLAGIVEFGSVKEALVGLELARQIPSSGRSVLAAAKRRPDTQSDPDLQAAVQLLPSTPPLARFPAPSYTRSRFPEAHHQRPVGEVHVQMPAGEFLTMPVAQPLSPRLVSFLVALMALGSSLLLLRRWPEARAFLFPIGGITLGVLCLLVLEMLFAVAGVRSPSELKPVLDPNNTQGPRYASRILEGTPHVTSERADNRYLAFTLQKPTGVKRVVTLGESSVHGTHYLDEESFSSRLSERLGPQVEVLNLGIGAALSDDILVTGLAALQWNPDLLVLYYGYNDLTHIPAMERYESFDKTGMTWRRELSRWRLARLLAAVLPDLSTDFIEPSPSPLDRVDRSPQQAIDIADFARGNAILNMVRLGEAAERAGVQVLLVAQASNEHVCDLGTSRLELLEVGCYRDELAGVMREVSRQLQLPYFDAAAMMRAMASQDRSIEPVDAWAPMFWDGVHPTREGHELLALALDAEVHRLLDLD